MGTWNCRSAVNRKADLIRCLGADVLVVPECRSDPVLATEPDVEFVWSGLTPRQGLGIFAMNGWRMKRLRRRGIQPWCLPVAVYDPAGEYAFDLLGIWTIAGAGRPGYVRQFTATLESWRRRLARPYLVIAGDLNDSLRTSDSGAPSANLERLRAAGLRSAYHQHFAAEPGAEESATMRWIGPGRVAHVFHIDFVFLSADLLSRLTAVEVGSMADWVESGHSDHCPVVATLSPGT